MGLAVDVSVAILRAQAKLFPAFDFVVWTILLALIMNRTGI